MNFERKVTSRRTHSQCMDKNGPGQCKWTFKKPSGKIPQERLLMKQSCGMEGLIVSWTLWFMERKQ